MNPKIAFLLGAVALAPAAVADLDKAWLICQHENMRFEQCGAVYQAQRDRATVREDAARDARAKKDHEIESFLDHVLETIK